MKVNELMIGDYVYDLYGGKAIVLNLEGYNEHVKACGAFFELVEGPEEGKTFFLYGQIEPIPLTPEILEKNGWELSETGSHCQEDTENRLEISIIDNEIYWTINVNEYDILPIKYVHELQHALRLCGIEKKIVL